MSALQATPTPHGISILNSELRTTVTQYRLIGSIEQDATSDLWQSFYENTIETSYYDDNGVLTFVLDLPVEQHFEEYLHQIHVLDSNNQPVIKCSTPKVALPKGIGGMVTIKAALSGQAGEIIFKHSEFVTETEFNEQYLYQIQKKLKALPIYPEIVNEDNRLSMSLDGTTLSIDDEQIIRFHGWLEVNTSDYPNKSFQVDLEKSYHVRFNLVDGFYIRDVDSSEYNPASLDETDKQFDTTYDDMNLALLCNRLLMRCIHTNQLSKAVTLTGNGTVLVPLCPRLRNIRLTFSNLEQGASTQTLTIPATVEKGGYGYFQSLGSRTGMRAWNNADFITLTTNNRISDTTVSVNTISFSRRLRNYQTNQNFTEIVEVGVHEWLLRSEFGPCLLAWKQQGMSLNYTNLVTSDLVVEYLR